MKYDLLLTGGDVLDPAGGLRGLMDIGIAGGKISRSSSRSGRGRSALEAEIDDLLREKEEVEKWATAGSA
jgi:hypothetical protein